MSAVGACGGNDGLEQQNRAPPRRLEEAATLAAEAEKRAEEEIKALEADLEREREEKEKALAAAEERLGEIETQVEAAEKRVEAAERRADVAEGTVADELARARESAAGWLQGQLDSLRREAEGR
jgi:predicted  nucleic acid-binding Zn-ribbon protein